ncbi:hypothetical protein [Streptomyces sp. TLI_146]|uniref:hypothetical protein n=1 Tax=Streptomyces sp. TLI_146 TaxID=1938858 RepID=UPI000C6FE17C|nr:hypothetical protein [Streptomyces sp. TLI_146]PKV89282.1 hypothetical protein BX283_6918 [Streptomyces sp. TLI_146]
MNRRLGTLAAVGALTLGATGAGTAAASAPSSTGSGHTTATAEIFATDNTATITDPADPRLKARLVRFDHEVREVIRTQGAKAGRSTLLDGVFWSSDLKQATYERSREFDVNHVSAAGLHHIADVIRKQYKQESVLTFRHLPRTSPETNAVDIEATGVTSRKLHDALLADPEARDELGGGSVTARDGRLILIAPVADLPLAKKFVGELGVDWNKAQVRYGAEEFVGG